MSHRFDLGAALFFFILGVAFVFGARDLAGAVYGSSITSGTFPNVFGYALAGLSALLMFETFKKAQKTTKEDSPRFYKRFATVFIAAVFYILLLELLGYVITTFLFLMVSFQAMEKGSLLKSALVAAVFSLGIYVLFVVLLQGSLPAWPNFI